MRAARPLAAACAFGLAILTFADIASAAPPYVERRQTLPAVSVAFDGALGVGRYQFGAIDGIGSGLNLELGVGVIRHLELGVRHGIRFGDDGRFANADFYGRLYDWKTFESGGSTFTNPEARVRGQLVDLEVFELSLEGRLVLPFAANTDVGMMFGVPLTFHLGRIARLDTGAYVNIVARDGTPNRIILPLDVWFQLTERFWMGPRIGFVVNNPGGATDVPLGMGLGYQFARWGDFKAGLLFPAVDDAQGSRFWGVGAGVQLRIE